MRRARERLCVAAAWACATAVLAYAALRPLEVVAFPEPNPATVLWALRSSFVWRSITAAYLGTMGAFGGFALASRRPAAAARWLARVVALAAVAIAIQGTLLP